MNIVDIIAKKRDGGELTSEEIGFLISGVAAGSVPDYQSAAWLMAVYIRGMNRRETLDLTLAMRDTGSRIDLSDLPGGPSVDKHSTGGVGDKTSLVVVPILVAAGIPILKMSGRGLGYSGGTVDKLESIPGLRTNLSIEEAKSIVRRVGAVMIGQSKELAPADKALYALRDVTATIECVPLIASSIMSKKLAAGGQRIVLDVKCGKGAFMKTLERAKLLAQQLVEIGNGARVPTVAIISAMNEPLGKAVGNALEVEEAIQMLQPGTAHSSTAERIYTDLCIELAAYGLLSAGKASTLQSGRSTAMALVKNGKALDKLVGIIAAQGGANSSDGILESLPRSQIRHDVISLEDGVVIELDAEVVGRLAIDIGAGRLEKGDVIDPAAGIYLHKKTGDHVSEGEPLATLHLSDKYSRDVNEFEGRLSRAYTICDDMEGFEARKSLVLGVVG